MKIEKMLDKYKNVAAMAIVTLLVLAPVAYYVVRDAFPQSAEPFLEKPDPKYQKCVRDTTYMRFHHMDLLKEIRVQVVREGKRTDIGFKDCRKCHTNRDRFCNQCHNAVNLHLDCFGCHNYPESSQETVNPALSKRKIPSGKTIPDPQGSDS